jgi:hypothetical protein
MVKTALDGQSDKSCWQLVPSPSRKHAIHIRGTKEFLENFRTYLSGIDLTDEQLDRDIEWKEELTHDDLHVAKITFYYTDGDTLLPMEIQCVTEKYRAAMRTGKIAHWLHKAGKKGSPEAKNSDKYIKELSDRKLQMQEPDSINLRSASGSWDLRWQIERYDAEHAGKQAVKAAARR